VPLPLGTWEGSALPPPTLERRNSAPGAGVSREICTALVVGFGNFFRLRTRKHEANRDIIAGRQNHKGSKTEYSLTAFGRRELNVNGPMADNVLSEVHVPGVLLCQFPLTNAMRLIASTSYSLWTRVSQPLGPACLRSAPTKWLAGRSSSFVRRAEVTGVGPYLSAKGGC